ncbi:MAG: PKD domain-containing protein [Microthrixaceae bacterium]|nr:PKD domain-containing protein [Microthrixaceae bacterium]
MIGAIARARHRRSQAGYTVLELMIGVAITAIVLVPLMSWAVLVMRQQPIERDGMMRTAQSGLLGTMLPSDVSVAGQAWVSGMNEPWATDCSGGVSANGSVQLVMISSGATVQKVVYSVAPTSDDASQLSIWRRTCGIGSDDSLVAENQLFRGAKPGLTAVTCSSPGGDTPCREIELTMTPHGSNQAIELTATRRVDNSDTSLDALGNPLPVAVITLVSRSTMQPMQAVFSAENSTVGAGRSIKSYAWEFEPDVTPSDPTAKQVTASFPLLGVGQPNRDFTVRLTVTDDLDRSNTAFFRISSSNADPVAVISRITPNPANIGDTVTFYALPVGGMPGSYDPDGSIIRFDWLISLPQADPADPPREVVLSGPTVSYTTKAGDAGDASVRLSVTDLQLGQATVSAALQIIDPGSPPTTAPEPGGPVVASFIDKVGTSALVRDFDASATTGVDPSATFAWDFGDGTTGTGMLVSHTYPKIGDYEVTLTATASDNRSGTAHRTITVTSGTLPAPARVRHNGTQVLWDPVAGAYRYLVDFEFKTPTDCFKVIANQAVGVGPNPLKQIPRNPCPRTATSRARVGVDSGTTVTWSNWITIPTINDPVATTTTTTVVK